MTSAPWRGEARLLASILLVVVAACTGASGTTTTTLPGRAPTTTTSVLSTQAMTSTTTVPPAPSPTGVLASYHAALAAANLPAATELLAPGAVWSIEGVDVTLGRPLSAELAWLPDAVGAPEATSESLVETLLRVQEALQTRSNLTDCIETGQTVTCTYTAIDVLTPVVGEPASGTVTAEVAAGTITRYRLDAPFLPDLRAAPDAFHRWVAIENPDATRDLPLADWALAWAPLAVAWEAAGRPDVGPPAITDDPVAVVESFFAARNGGDWEAMVASLGGDALLDPFASRDEFDAAQLLERDITIQECKVILEDARGTRLGCRLTVTDIITAAAGIVATNPNQTTVQVADGRVTGAPQFVPSSFLAEQAIEEWAQANVADAYASACPDGIAGQSPIDGLACAEFVAAHRDGWGPVVAALDL